MKTVTLTDLQTDVLKYLELAELEDIIILKEGRPIGLLRGFSNEDDSFDRDLENHPLFKERVRKSRQKFREGKGISLEEVKAQLHKENLL
ncbi:MAG: prevent-host-death protein [Oscillatoriales cyanobacterium RU_3_3]|nr:prevent-host-death protein [Microcoleus sp. SU_5_6]NJL68603.1 prevent-host-death protein [Microcoleus sp. SM1_3_4]NJM59655.1 prevent-host-death protein [Oscillatoriales cyanobacterium RU_3_3]NJR23845.1 prevent-host-death protein [Richelia sp. CSU_2_1]